MAASSWVHYGALRSTVSEAGARKLRLDFHRTFKRFQMIRNCTLCSRASGNTGRSLSVDEAQSGVHRYALSRLSAKTNSKIC